MRHCSFRVYDPRSAASGMPTTTPWPRPPSGSTRTNASEPTRRSAAARCAPSADVEFITADYVAWYNQQRLMHRLGRVPPAEAEAQLLFPTRDRPTGRLTETRGCMKPNAVNFAVSAGQCLSSGKDVAAVMFWMTHCGLIERR